MATWYIDTDADEASPDGTEAHPYNTLNEAEQAKDGNITGAGPTTFICQGNTQEDTAAVAVADWTTTSSDYVEIKTVADRHDGTWDTGAYRLVTSNAGALLISENYVRIDGLQIHTSSIDGADQVVNITGQDAANDVRVSNCVVRGANTTSFAQAGVAVADTDAILTLWNTIIYGIGAKVDTGATGVSFNSATANVVYGCTIIGGYYGIRAITGKTVTVKNTYSSGSSAAFKADGTISGDYNASSDNTAHTLFTNHVASVAADNDTFVDATNADLALRDYHLAADGLSPLQGAGTTLTDDPPGSTALGVDIDGESRS